MEPNERERTAEQERQREADAETGEQRKKTPPVSDRPVVDPIERGPAERHEQPRR